MGTELTGQQKAEIEKEELQEDEKNIDVISGTTVKLVLELIAINEKVQELGRKLTVTEQKAICQPWLSAYSSAPPSGEASPVQSSNSSPRRI